MRDFFSLAKILGSTPLLVQGGGGNISFKRDGVLIVKASGIFLRQVRNKKGYVSIRQEGLAEWIVSGNTNEEEFDMKVAQNIIPDLSFGRPSIETAFHVVLPKPVVAHTHAVYVNVLGCMEGGREIAMELFGARNVVWVPYTTPGLPVAVHIASVETDSVNIFVLENHGLLVQGSTVGEVLNTTTYVTDTIKKYLREKQALPQLRLTRSDYPFTKHLFPDSVVYGQIDPCDLTGDKKKVYIETSAVSVFIEESIRLLNGTARYLPSIEIERLSVWDKEKLRLSSISNK